MSPYSSQDILPEKGVLLTAANLSTLSHTGSFKMYFLFSPIKCYCIVTP